MLTFIHSTDPTAPAAPAKVTDDTQEKETEDKLESQVQGCFAQIEVTDGWYGVTAVLDKKLTQALHKGKIFAGQKLRIYGAKVNVLCAI